MKLRVSFSIITVLCLTAFFCPYLIGQTDTIVYPWTWGGLEEYMYLLMPVGGWNTGGVLTPRAMAMGETLSSGQNAASGNLNPAFLSELADPEFHLSYRYAENSYKSYASVYIPYWRELASNPYMRSFRSREDRLDSVGFSLPVKGWVFGAGYGVFQEYDIPDISHSYYWYSKEVRQSGSAKAIHVDVARRVTSSFSLGFSVVHIFGDIRREETWPYGNIIIPYIEWDNPSPEVVPPFWPWGRYRETYNVDISATFFNIGFTFKPSDRWILGLSLRPPFTMKLNTEFSMVYEDPYWIPPDSYASECEFKQPLIASASLLYKPIPALDLAADLAFWGWNNASSDYQAWLYPGNFKNILKINMGAEYRLGLPFKLIRNLALRAGYIYDPQPYRGQESTARSLLTAGFGLEIGRVSLDVAAKLPIGSADVQRFQTCVLQAGVRYRF